MRITSFSLVVLIVGFFFGACESPTTFERDNPSDPGSSVFNPKPPTDLSIALSDETIALSWTDNSQREDGYLIERAVDSGPFAEVVRLASNTTSFSEPVNFLGFVVSYRVSSFLLQGSVLTKLDGQEQSLELSNFSEHFPRHWLTIGAFINGTAQVGSALLANAVNKPFYIMHGDNDRTVNLQTGFFPIRDALINAGAIVNTLILEEVGHPINFPDRDQRLSDAFRWLDSTSTSLAVSVEDDEPPRVHQPGILRPNYPNSFRHSTIITYAVRRPGRVQIRVYNVLGQLMRTMVDVRKTPGEYILEWEGTDSQGKALPGGAYFYTLTVDHGPSIARPMILMQ